jgi:predicted acylesterase/phospholipase RssA/ABC-type phosphate/phosphonate transport system substrate-binding protein
MIWTISLLSLAAALQIPAAGSATQKPQEIRVGIVAFEDFRNESARSERLLAELTAASEVPVRFKLAVGTYGDLVHWLNAGLVDVAVVTPGLFAEISQSVADGAPVPRFLATVGKPAAASKWARAERKQPGYYDHYHAICAVAADSPLKSAADLQAAAAKRRVRFLCVHPLSVSSRIAPAFALRQMGIELRDEQIEYTHSHSASLRGVASGGRSGPEPVAFVWDDAARGLADLAERVRVIPLPELDRLEIPSDAVVAHSGFEHADLVERLLLAHTAADGEHDFLRPREWKNNYESVQGWRRAIGLVEGVDPQNISLGEIGRLLVQHARSQPAPPRLALVLSGGGAKCAYQVGVVRAVEEQLEELRGEDPDGGFDISIVVGTSGGAINALPIALGVTRTAEGRDDFLNVWTRLDQRKIVRPSLVVRGNIGLWFALLQTALVLWVMRRWVNQPSRRGWVFGGLFTGLAAMEIVIRYLDIAPWSWLGRNHWLHHAWLWMTFGITASAWSVLVAGLAVLARQWTLVRRGAFLAISSRRATWALAAGLLGLPFVQVVTVLFYQGTLSGGEGMEEALVDHIPGLIDRHLTRLGQKPLAPTEGRTDALRLKAVSRQVIDRRVLSRDLVITGSCLDQSTPGLPTDLYFFSTGGGATTTPPFGSRGVSLAEHPGQLLDVVLGSGSIFPVFPARRLEDFPEYGEYVDLVDGGFAHNSPIEAAVLWGATHIILIEASPRERAGRANFLQNAAASLDHLYEQAQLLDTRARGKVSVFTLAPEPPHLCVLDFADNLIRDAFEKGYRDAAGRGSPGTDRAAGRPRFRKELGEPVFREVAAGR